MVRIGFFDITGFNPDDLKAKDAFPGAVSKKIENTKNPAEKKLRIAAYTLLFKMCKGLFENEEIPEIIYTPQGKPCFFGNNNCHFNISHDKGAVAVAISDSVVGVDVQSHRLSREAEERIRARFADALETVGTHRKMGGEVSLSVYEVRSGELFEREKRAPREIFLTEKKENDFYSRWTLFEAALKLDGGGFAAISSLKAIIERAGFKSFEIASRSEKYTLSVAIEE